MDACLVCESRVEFFDAATVLGRHRVSYFRCQSCGYVSTERPYWLNEAYERAIAPADIGLVARSMKMAAVTKAVIVASGIDRSGKFLDYGGGYGLLVRLLRDSGFDFYLVDPHCDNLFADGFGFEESPAGQFSLATAFEVIEHLPSPIEDVRGILAYSENLLFSTELVPDPPPLVSDWWYFGAEAGQHVSFHTTRSLEILAEQLGQKLYSDGKSVHMLSAAPMPAGLLRMALSARGARVVSALLRHRAPRRSLLEQDVAACQWRVATGLGRATET